MKKAVLEGVSPVAGKDLYFKKFVFQKNSKNNMKLKYNKYNKTIITK